MSHGVADLGVLHEFRFAGGAGGEVDEHRILGGGVGGERAGGGHGVGVVVGVPAVDGVGADCVGAYGDTHVGAVDALELGGVAGVGDGEPGAAAADPILQVGGAERAGGGHDDRAEFGDGEHRLPQFDLVAEHEDHPIALADTELREPGGHQVGAGGHLVEGDLALGAVLLGDPQGGAIVAAGDRVEPVDRPVERPGDSRPGELPHRGVVVGHRLEQPIPAGPVDLGVARHRRCPHCVVSCVSNPLPRASALILRPARRHAPRFVRTAR